MCEPVSIASMALAAASVVANQIASSKVAGARDDALAAERIRQGGYNREIAGLNTQSQDRYQSFGQNQDRKAAELGEYFAQPAIQPNEVFGGSIPTTSGLTAREGGKQSAKAQQYGAQQGMARGNVAAFGDLLGGIGRGQARDASQIGIYSGFKKGSAGVLPFELNDANQKGDGLKTLGDVLKLAGMVTGAAALAGGPASAASSAAEVSNGAAVSGATAGTQYGTLSNPFYGRLV